MPTNTQRIVGALASIGITVAGAWLASQAQSGTEKQALTSFPNGVNVTFTGVRNGTGNIVVLVFADRGAFKAYDVTKAVGYKETPARTGAVNVTFPSLTSGPYVVSAFHDEDQNKDLNMQGERPLEGYTTSGAADQYDAPTFEKAALTEDSTTLKMFYLSD